jgi:ribonuclease J
MVITHGHLDHIGGLPFIMERIGNPPIYTQNLSSLMILKRQEEFPHMEPFKMNVIKEGEAFTVGTTRIKTLLLLTLSQTRWELVSKPNTVT